ncbi:hypothetical protein [Halobaculum magnesiiphilum]|uniref:Uncharacterized protein n=1 Tax=Halobaculum magnesiiphilum TaxID=1017351 RepID=A0A8T8WC11_9EURY|nr:hypothetical protein [Halobaculum magnesiiphilum]QZP37361.1 hypothetical protein K6T50_13940 [Halobaculum magnesiiphilum]
MHPLVRALLAFGVVPLLLALSFVLVPDPTGTTPILVGLGGSLVAVPVAYLAIGRAEA